MLINILPNSSGVGNTPDICGLRRHVSTAAHLPLSKMVQWQGAWKGVQKERLWLHERYPKSTWSIYYTMLQYTT